MWEELRVNTDAGPCWVSFIGFPFPETYSEALTAYDTFRTRKDATESECEQLRAVLVVMETATRADKFAELMFLWANRRTEATRNRRIASAAARGRTRASHVKYAHIWLQFISNEFPESHQDATKLFNTMKLFNHPDKGGDRFVFEQQMQLTEVFAFVKTEDEYKLLVREWQEMLVFCPCPQVPNDVESEIRRYVPGPPPPDDKNHDELD